MSQLSCNTDLTPLPDELLYSFQARIGLHGAILSPKSLIERLYNNRNIAASLVYSSHLETLADALNHVNANDLINRHTLFPLAAPFIPEKRCLQCITRMKSDNGLGLHLASGYAASKIPKLKELRYCPACLEAQIKQFGEPYWMRSHQIVGTDVCVFHECTLESIADIKKGQHRHSFLPATTRHRCTARPAHIQPSDRLISKACEQLLSNTDLPSPELGQWTNYYKHLARSLDATKGIYVDFEPLKCMISDFWSPEWLKRYNLSLSDTQSNWLHCIFRKHRKTFSYLEHIVVNAALLKGQFNIVDCINNAAIQAKSLRKYDSVSILVTLSSGLSNQYKENWLRCLQTQSPKFARASHPALYTRIYRADRQWLIATNKQYRVKRPAPSDNVDWEKRDVNTTKSLFRVIYSSEDDLSRPRASKRWLMYQLPNTSTVEKYIRKMPLTLLFLNRYAESVTEYQIRRITYQLLTNPHRHITRRWFLIRAAGLSDARITLITKLFLNGLSTSQLSENLFFQSKISNNKGN
ncbi:TnsD family Tn7-like transposition protein [uncultured Paraglaciecola sp.]|uniref:TnsD family Tn7-like transposition protein n=1 Tax=uncultured Paraglaciecola sp. TaxID=1765024 RepID=UPI0030D79D78